jgi:hypothetical protein
MRDFKATKLLKVGHSDFEVYVGRLRDAAGRGHCNAPPHPPPHPVPPRRTPQHPNRPAGVPNRRADGRAQQVVHQAASSHAAAPSASGAVRCVRCGAALCHWHRISCHFLGQGRTALGPCLARVSPSQSESPLHTDTRGRLWPLSACKSGHPSRGETLDSDPPMAVETQFPPWLFGGQANRPD